MDSNKTDKKTKQNRDAENPRWRKEIGLRISNAREKSGMSQNELADKLGVNRVTLTYWENGTRDIKTTDIVRLADALDVSCDYLLRGVSAESISVNDELGLSEKAVQVLKTVNNLKKAWKVYDKVASSIDFPGKAKDCELYQRKYEIDIINRLIESAEFSDIFAHMVEIAELDVSSLFDDYPFSKGAEIEEFISEESPKIYDLIYSKSCVLSPIEYFEMRRERECKAVLEYIEAIFIGDSLKEYIERSCPQYVPNRLGYYNDDSGYNWGVSRLNLYQSTLRSNNMRLKRLQKDIEYLSDEDKVKESLLENDYADNNETE